MFAYISEALAKGTLGAYISVGLYALVGVLAILGAFVGIRRGLSKSIVRFFTVAASAFAAVYATVAVSNIIVNVMNDPAVSNGRELVEKRFPSVAAAFNPTISDILAEINPQTATIFAMMIIAVFVLPVVFLALFYILKSVTMIIYKLLSGLIGAVSYGQGLISMIGGGLVGAVQGIVIACVIIIPISGMSNVAAEARGTVTAADKSGTIETVYTKIIDDLAETPLFDTVDSICGDSIFGQITTVTVNGERMDMCEESKTLIAFAADALPLANPSFHWENPTDDERAAFGKIVENIGEDELLASLTSDIMRGIAKSVRNGNTKLPFEGTNKILMDDVMKVFETSDKYNVEGDLNTVVEVYYIMCDRGLLSAFTESNKEVLRDLLTDQGENGDTIIDEIVAKLKENDRTKPVVHTFTKISLSLMHESLGLEGDSAQLYDDVKGGIKDAITHSRDDFATEEEYKAQVSADLDKTLDENKLVVSDEVKQNMVDYIANNYGDKNSDEITDDDINDAILSYYSSYASAQNKTEGGEGETP